MPGQPRFIACADRTEAAQAVAGLLRDALEAELAFNSRASLVVSGGSTPLEALECLSGMLLDWSRVVALPSDERWVDGAHADSNAGMVRRCLLQGPAAGATLFPLHREGWDVDRAAAELAAQFTTVPSPRAGTLLGMGADGHFASLFPDYDGLQNALDPACPQALVAVRTAASPHPRISLTLPALVDTRCLLLLIFGADKRRVYEAALDGDASLPVTALLRQAGAALTTAWAP